MRVNIWNVLDEFTLFVFVCQIEQNRELNQSLPLCLWAACACSALWSPRGSSTLQRPSYLMLLEVSGLHRLSSSYVFTLCVRNFSHTNKHAHPKFESSHYFDPIPQSVTHLMFYSCKTHSFKQFLSYVPTNLQPLAFLFSSTASWGLSFSQKPGHDVNAAYWRQGSDSRRQKKQAIKLVTAEMKL